MYCLTPRTSKTKRGLALMAVLFAMAVAGLLSVLVFVGTRHSLRLMGEEGLVKKEEVLFRGDLYKTAVRKAGMAGKWYSCFGSKRKVGADELGGSLCMETEKFDWSSHREVSFNGNDLGKLEGRPKFDFNFVFGSFESCTSTWFPGATTTNGVALSVGSLKSSYMCKQSRIRISQRYAVNSNLEVVDEVVASSSNLMALGAIGYMDMTKLTLKGKLLLVAGGDILIDKLVMEPLNDNELILISGSGDVKIASSSGDAKIFAYAKNKVAFPRKFTALDASSQSNIPTKPIEVLGRY